jgi:leucyl aminopeptidase (aminopeptidase T)
VEKARVLIVLTPIVNDPSLFSNNFKTSQYNRTKEYEKTIRRLAQHQGVRVVYVNLATKPIADLLLIKMEDYESMLQKANLVDSELMNANINRLSGLLKNASKVRITNPIGTDISFLITNRRAIIHDGKITGLEAQILDAFNRVVTLPAGILRISVIEGSGMGRVVITESECNYKAMQQINFKINRGKIEKWNATSGGTCFHELLRLNSSNWQVGSLGFSFNWEIKTINEDGLRFWREDGGPLIWITLGGNEDLGGQISNDVRQFSFPIEKPTIEIDGKIVIKANQ